MLPKVAIVTDSMANLPRELVEQYGIAIVPISIYFQGRVYRDWVDITPAEAYELVMQDPEHFTTSPASPSDYLEAYREASQRAKNVLCITISSRLSTGYEMASAAKEQAQTELPEVSVDVFDSQLVLAAQGFVALAAARAAEKGGSLDWVIKVAESVRERANFVVLLDTMRYVYRTGRIPKVAARIASMLNIRPILSMSGGLVHFAGAVRNREHGINRILRITRDKVGNGKVHIAVMHAYASEEAEKLRKRVSSEFDCAELWITEFSPVMGYATGTGTVGLAFYHD